MQLIRQFKVDWWQLLVFGAFTSLGYSQPILLLGATALPQVHVVHETVALSDRRAPGTDGGEVFASLGPADINDFGQLTFLADLKGPGVNANNNRGFWAGTPGMLELVAREQEPTFLGDRFGRIISRPRIANNGQLGLELAIDGDDLVPGLFVGAPGDLEVLALNGERAGGLPPDLVHAFGFGGNEGIDINSSGQVAYRGALAGPGVFGRNRVAVWTGSPGTVQLVARGDDPVPGGNAGEVFDSFRNPRISDNGHVAFRGEIFGPSVEDSNNDAIWAGLPGSIELVARNGWFPAGFGIEDRFIFSTIDTVPEINSAGSIAFFSAVAGPRITEDNNTAIWVGNSDALMVAVRENSAAPGTSAQFDRFESVPVINDLDQIAIRARLRGDQVNSTNDQSIWVGEPGNLRLVAREGSPADDAGASITFGRLLDDPVINDRGQVAFFAHLNGPGIDQSNDASIWMTDFTGTPHLIIKAGDELSVGDGDTRVVSELGMITSNTISQRFRRGFNNASQLSFNVKFTDNTYGSFIATLKTVPEPTTLVMLLFPALLHTCSRTRSPNSCASQHTC